MGVDRAAPTLSSMCVQVCVCVCVCVRARARALVLIAQSYMTLCDPRNCSPPGSSGHGILQATILEWVAIPFSRGSSQCRDRTWVFFTAVGFFTL